MKTAKTAIITYLAEKGCHTSRTDFKDSQPKRL